MSSSFLALIFHWSFRILIEKKLKKRALKKDSAPEERAEKDLLFQICVQDFIIFSAVSKFLKTAVDFLEQFLVFSF
jgi:hypothetical protein